MQYFCCINEPKFDLVVSISPHKEVDQAKNFINKMVRCRRYYNTPHLNYCTSAQKCIKSFLSLFSKKLFILPESPTKSKQFSVVKVCQKPNVYI